MLLRKKNMKHAFNAHGYDDDILIRKMNHFQSMGTAMKKSILIYVFAQN